MSEDEAMNIDQTELQKLKTLTNGTLASSISKLLNISRTIPSERDFHFYYNFPEFKSPVKEITQNSQSLLKSIGSKSDIWEKDSEFPEDIDDAYDWLVNVNDEVFERFDVSVDEFKNIRKAEEESGKRTMESGDGFQVVCSKKKKKNKGEVDLVSRDGDSVNGAESSGVKVASLRDKKVVGGKPKVSFHIPTIRKPQDEYNIFVKNANEPFEHVWLPRSEDGQRGVHPMEKLSFLDFVDRNISDDEPVKPLSIEDTPFNLVQDVKELKDLAATLRNVDEFAVDLEHNHYRSFQGLTCLMQISTRTEDFIVDTLKLRIHVGPYLREVFKDPSKRKVMHGADRDILWLQRDFGIYVCNLFDTGQASRVLKLERNSLEYLLHHFCGVTANKEYQNADWRLRPLPDEMLRYAREDTHYLLHIYDLMKIKLILMSEESASGNSTDALVEVYKRSCDICMQLYEKELLTENSYLHVYGLQGAGFNAHQVAIVAGLYGWRDAVARAEDESTGYILPNKMLLEIAKQMPLSAGKLRRLLKMRHPYVERNLSTVVGIILHSMQNAAAYEAAVEQLKEKRTETVPEENPLALGGPEALGPDTQTLDAENVEVQVPESEELLESLKTHSSGSNSRVGLVSEDSLERRIESNRSLSGTPSVTENRNANDSNKVTTVSIQAVKKPAGAFGALLGNSVSKRKSVANNKDKKEVKLEQIRSSVSLPFHSFMGFEKQVKAKVEEPISEPTSECQHEHDLSAVPPSTSTVEDIMLLEGNSSNDEFAENKSENTVVAGGNESNGAALEVDNEEDTMTLNDLSSSFKQCFQSINESRKAGRKGKNPEAGHILQLKPFDYEAARSEVKFGETEEESVDEDDGLKSSSKSRKKKSSTIGEARGDDGNKPIPQGRRRLAFPATGNRSATFR